MKIWTPLISGKEAVQILDSDNSYTIEDRIKIASLPYNISLTEAIGELHPDELSQIRELEAQNIAAMIELSAVVFNNDWGILSGLFLDMPPYILSMLEIPSKNILAYANFYYIMRYMLCMNSCNKKMIPTFEGEIPSKLFKFRKRKAKMWYNEYTQYVLKITDFFLQRSGPEEAKLFLLTNTAWYLNKSHPAQYNKKQEDKDMNETLKRILKEFSENVGKEDLYDVSIPDSALLHKEL